MEQSPQNAFRSGFIAIIGCPNAGKSTLLNRLVGQKIAIVTDKAQTTRTRITGILTHPDCQMIFLDTPGMTEPRNKLGAFMQKTAEESTRDVDAILFLVDARHPNHERDTEIISRLTRGKTPLIIALNKADIAGEDRLQNLREQFAAIAPKHEIINISAKTGAGVDELEALLRPLMPHGPLYYPADQVTDQPERTICAEMIREKALLFLRDEIPHGLGVSIEKMENRGDGGKPENGDLWDVWASIYCEHERHKGMVIGKQGIMLKKIGTAARRDIEWLLDARVNLQLWVKTKNDWRNKPSILAELGYHDKL